MGQLFLFIGSRIGTEFEDNSRVLIEMSSLLYSKSPRIRKRRGFVVNIGQRLFAMS